MKHPSVECFVTQTPKVNDFEVKKILLAGKITNETVSEMQYFLLARNESKNTRNISLHHSSNYQNGGLKVENKVCFEKLVCLFNAAPKTQIIVEINADTKLKRWKFGHLN